MFELRELRRTDIETINKWRNNVELIDLLGAPFRFINSEVDLRWFEHYMGNRQNTVRCAITEKGEEEILGLVSLTDIDYLNQSAELHIMIGDKCNRGRGIGTFAVNEIVLHAFNNMNLHRIELSVLDSNIAAIRLYEKCGFIQEGLKRNVVFKDGKFVDMRIYACLREMR